MNTPDIEPQLLPTLQFSIRLVPASLVARFADYARPYIKRALDKSGEGFCADDILVYAIQGKIQLWLIAEGNRVVGAATTELVNFPNDRYCRVCTIAGSKFEEWVEYFLLELEPWAKEQQATNLQAYVRRGFVPKLLQYGFKPKCVTVTKQL